MQWTLTVRKKDEIDNEYKMKKKTKVANYYNNDIAIILIIMCKCKCASGK